VANINKHMKHSSNMEATNVVVADVQATILVVDDM
jgi:hypothetical protein